MKRVSAACCGRRRKKTVLLKINYLITEAYAGEIRWRTVFNYRLRIFTVYSAELFRRSEEQMEMSKNNTLLVTRSLIHFYVFFTFCLHNVLRYKHTGSSVYGRKRKGECSRHLSAVVESSLAEFFPAQAKNSAASETIKWRRELCKKEVENSYSKPGFDDALTWWAYGNANSPEYKRSNLLLLSILH